MARGDDPSMEGGSRCVSTARTPSPRSVEGLDIVVFIYYKFEIELLLTYTSSMTSVVYAAHKCCNRYTCTEAILQVLL
jgi:hypothetical protein